MLPTYPKLVRNRQNRNMETVHARVRQLSPMIGMIKGHQLFEGRSSAIQREDGKLDETPIHRASGEVTIRREMLIDFNETTVARHLEEIAEQLARNMSEQFQQRMNEVTAATGNVIDGGGKPFSEDTFLDSMEVMEHNFDKDGNWRPPTMIVGPGMAEKIAAAGEMSAAGNKRLKAILEGKRDDHRRREAARILVG
jgi:CRISPR/Cas system CSM-associated protein Csm5 (group 7 of RAMP superfamily)